MQQRENNSKFWAIFFKKLNLRNRMSQKLKLLIVEDDDAIREILTDLLVDEGYECASACDGVKATELLSVSSFDVLISDFRMPRMNGAELLEWCRARGLHLPVIFLTANKDLFPHEKLALNDCCAALLQKPIDIDHLILAITDAKTRNHHRHCQL